MSLSVGNKALRLDEEALHFASAGHNLPGILTRPQAPSPGGAHAGTGVLLISPGLKHRVGPHRLQHKLARFFASRGLSVFRFDFHGTGDAEGELPGDSVPELHERIQNGMFLPDSLAALECFCERADLDRVIACGLCGGAITGVYTAAADPRVEAIVGFQLPVKVMDLEQDFADQITEEYSDFILTLYLKKILNPTAWKNFITGRSEYRLIWKTASRRLGRLAGRNNNRPQEIEIPAGMNRNFLRAYDEIAGRVKMQWIYSEQERARYDFESEFEQICLDGRDRPYEKVIIPESNHEFAPDAAQECLLEQIGGWLSRHYEQKAGEPA